MKDKSKINFWRVAINRVCDSAEKTTDNEQKAKLLRLGALFNKYLITELKGATKWKNYNYRIYIENFYDRKERGGSKIYYNKEKNTKAQREHRKYKQNLFLKGKLKWDYGNLSIWMKQLTKGMFLEI